MKIWGRRITGFCPLALGLSMLLVGCASLGNTPAQNAAWAAWKTCYAAGALAGVELSSIDANGTINYIYRAGWGANSNEVQRCLRREAKQSLVPVGSTSAVTAAQPGPIIAPKTQALAAVPSASPMQAVLAWGFDEEYGLIPNTRTTN